ncbi:hypothetical protein F7734_02055 [Scytonema sp. UIC 10036]|uniref:hypothetical protein n=1 Tax=Scytonema sp. UIC 10036 TaxID=2304196 RepID=UPI0012DAC850|nr:hypothetical protein [Scytonema sp. UIC 10036]MUG91334.1 hypothetical protein [Scytonema sp. UIC 10036]
MNPNFIKAIATIFLIGITAAIAFWKQILQWADNILFPWLEQNFKTSAQWVRDAFARVDRYVAIPIRNAIKQAWQKLRQFLLKLLVRFKRNVSEQWVRQWISWGIKHLENGEVVPVKREVEEVVEWGELPPDVREEWLRKAKGVYELDFTQLRDAEIAEMSMSN